MKILISRNTRVWGWRDDLSVKSTAFPEDLGTIPSNPHSGFVTLVAGDPTTSSGFLGYCMHMEIPIYWEKKE